MFFENCLNLLGANEPVTDLVNPYGFTPELDLIHNLTCVLSVLLCQEFAETIALMCHRYTVLWQMYVHYKSVNKIAWFDNLVLLTDWTCLQH